MKTAGFLLLALVVAAAILLWLGARLPLRHRAIASMHLRQTPEVVYDAIADVVNAGRWRKDLKSIELLPPQNGQPRYRENSSNGAITYRIEAAKRPQRFVTRIDDATLPFGGSWTFAIAPDANGSRIEIAEDGEIRIPAFRFFAHYVFGYYRTLDAYLAALAEKFGETGARIEHTDSA
jgi:hypothetical protein